MFGTFSTVGTVWDVTYSVVKATIIKNDVFSVKHVYSSFRRINYRQNNTFHIIILWFWMVNQITGPFYSFNWKQVTCTSIPGFPKATSKDQNAITKYFYNTIVIFS